MNVRFDGMNYSIFDRWQRVTTAPETFGYDYPKAGQIITLAGHAILPDGRYLVTAVMLHEPPEREAPDGLDLRISVVGPEQQHDLCRPRQGLSGWFVMQAMVTTPEPAP